MKEKIKELMAAQVEFVCFIIFLLVVIIAYMLGYKFTAIVFLVPTLCWLVAGVIKLLGLRE